MTTYGFFSAHSNRFAGLMGKHLQYQNLARDAGLYEVLAVCFNHTSGVRSTFPPSHHFPAPDPAIYTILHRNPCPESPRQNPKLSNRPCTNSPSGSRTSESYTLHGSFGSRSNRSITGYTTRLWKGWRIRISSCVMRSRSRAIGMRPLRPYLAARDRLGRSGCCGRFSGCRITRAHEKQDLPPRSSEHASIFHGAANEVYLDSLLPHLNGS